jgi:hypothetical protein
MRFRFRELDKVSLDRDWKPSATSVLKDGLFASPQRLYHEPYVDPGKQVQPLRAYQPSQQKGRVGLKSGHSKSPRKNGIGTAAETAINSAARKHAGKERNDQDKSIPMTKGQLNSGKKYNALLHKFRNKCTKFHSVDRAARVALQERDAVLTEAGVPLPRSSDNKTAIDEVRQLSRLDKYNAWKSGLVNSTDFTFLQETLSRIMKSTTTLEEERNTYIAQRASVMYAVYGFSPHVVVLSTPESKDLGIEIEKAKGGFGYSISRIVQGSVAAKAKNIMVNDVVVELNGTFILDSTWEQVRRAFFAGKHECALVLVRSAERPMTDVGLPSTLAQKHHAREDNGGDGSGPESEEEPAKEEATHYDWQIGPNFDADIEARREWLLNNADLEIDPVLAAEWIALLNIRANRQAAAVQQVPDEVPKAAPSNTKLEQSLPGQQPTTGSWFKKLLPATMWPFK